ncbi:hypothetical protein KSC_029940 [Ktedonobacter sp. SOSP1-52]|nr:hypothetical protein KSC_029940 [Ktedonobacter sp. SOSP1-52]
MWLFALFLPGHEGQYTDLFPPGCSTLLPHEHRREADGPSDQHVLQDPPDLVMVGRPVATYHLKTNIVLGRMFPVRIAQASLFLGRVTVKVDPFPTSLSTVMVPPWRLTISCTM